MADGTRRGSPMSGICECWDTVETTNITRSVRKGSARALPMPVLVCASVANAKAVRCDDSKGGNEHNSFLFVSRFCCSVHVADASVVYVLFMFRRCCC